MNNLGSQKMLHLISSFGLFGAERVMLDLAKGMNDNGTQTWVGAIRNSHNPHLEVIEAAESQGLATLVLPSCGKIDLRAVFALKNFIRQKKITLLHTHNYKANIIGLLAAKLSGIPVVSTVHGYTNATSALKLYERLDRFILRHFFNKIVVVDEQQKKLFKPDTPVIKNGIDIEKFKTVLTRGACKNRLGIAEDKIVIGTVGRLSPEKNQGLLIQAAEVLLKRYQNLVFLIVGDGPLKDSLQSMVHPSLCDEISPKADSHKLEDKILFLGNRADVPEILGAMDIFVLPSLTEGLPLALLEAMAAGVPVVATKVGGVGQVVENEQTGLLVPSNNSDAIAKAIELLITDAQKRTSLAVNALQVVKNRYSQTAMLAKYRDLYQQLLDNPKVTTGKTFICFGSEDWGVHPSSSQHIMRALAKANRVLWIDSIGMRKPQVSKKDIFRVVVKLKKWFKGLRRIEENIWVYTPIVLPFHSWAIVQKINQLILNFTLKKLIKKTAQGKVFYWFSTPLAANLVKGRAHSVIYYMGDDYAGYYKSNAGIIKQAEADLLNRADLVFAASEELYERNKAINPQTHLISHGVDFAHFNQASLSQTQIAPELLALPKPVVAYIGLIRDWLDLGLIEQIARERPEWSIVMIGEVVTDVSRLRKIKNVYFLGKKRYDVLPQYLKGVDVAIIPYQQTEVVQRGNPLKLKELLAAGTAIVCTDFPTAREFKGVVEIAVSNQDFINKIKSSLKANTTVERAKRIATVQGETWEERVRTITTYLESLPK